MAKKEPTLQEVLDGMNKRFNMVFAEFERAHTENSFVQSQLLMLQERLVDVQKQQRADSEILDEIRDELDAIAKAVDKDAVTIINHERRIIRIEKRITTN